MNGSSDDLLIFFYKYLRERLSNLITRSDALGELIKLVGAGDHQMIMELIQATHDILSAILKENDDESNIEIKLKVCLLVDIANDATSIPEGLDKKEYTNKNPLLKILTLLDTKETILDLSNCLLNHRPMALIKTAFTSIPEYVTTVNLSNNKLTERKLAEIRSYLPVRPSFSPLTVIERAPEEESARQKLCDWWGVKYKKDWEMEMEMVLCRSPHLDCLAEAYDTLISNSKGGQKIKALAMMWWALVLERGRETVCRDDIFGTLINLLKCAGHTTGQ